MVVDAYAVTALVSPLREGAGGGARARGLWRQQRARRGRRGSGCARRMARSCPLTPCCPTTSPSSGRRRATPRPAARGPPPPPRREIARASSYGLARRETAMQTTSTGHKAGSQTRGRRRPAGLRDVCEAAGRGRSTCLRACAAAVTPRLTRRRDVAIRAADTDTFSTYHLSKLSGLRELAALTVHAYAAAAGIVGKRRGGECWPAAAAAAGARQPQPQPPCRRRRRRARAVLLAARLHGAFLAPYFRWKEQVTGSRTRWARGC